MKSVLSRLLPLFALAMVSLAPGCRSAHEDDPLEDDASAVGELDRLGPKMFRNTFAHYLRKEGKDDDAIERLIYLAPKDVTDPEITPDPAAPLARIDARFRSVRPSSLYEHGKATPMNPDRVDVEGALRRRPVHIVVLPGIFGEFIDASPFQEVLDAPSIARTRWERLAAEKSATPNARDEAFDPATVKSETRSLSELVRTGSIDDEGQPVVTVTYLKPLLGSLESLGTLEENAAVYLRRLRKYFALVGLDRDLYVLGYSRGAATALELVSQAAKAPAENPWTGKLRGVISLAGVLYGSQLADAARTKGTPPADVLEIIEGLARDLDTCHVDDGTATRLRVQASNTARWATAFAKVAWQATKLPRHPQIVWEGIDAAAPDYGRLTTFAKRLLVDDVFTLGSPLADYCVNVDRFKMTVKKTLDGIDSLTTASRLAWWRTHSLPDKVRYYALTGTMGDATRQPGQAWPEAKNGTAYDPASLDFTSLRTNYYDLLDASGIEANDSQVTLSRAKFWPALVPLLNPRQPALRTYFLGTLGTHHWGLAFPRAFATKDGLAANPYPRRTLLHAIGAFVTFVQQHEGG